MILIFRDLYGKNLKTAWTLIIYHFEKKNQCSISTEFIPSAWQHCTVPYYTVCDRILKNIIVTFFVKFYVTFAVTFYPVTWTVTKNVTISVKLYFLACGNGNGIFFVTISCNDILFYNVTLHAAVGQKRHV